MKEIRKENVCCLQFEELLKYPMIHGFSLKPLNFRNREGIHTDYHKLLNTFGIEDKNLVKPRQTHSDNIVILEHKKNSEKPDFHEDYLQNVDGIITNLKNVAIATTSADCLCTILYDKEKQVIGNIHSGWRGTFQKIIQNGVHKMKEVYDSKAEDILVFLMPAIHKCHFEVDTDVMEICQNTFAYTNELDKIIEKGRFVDGKQKYNIDTVLINQILLEEEGIPKNHIWDSGICSVCCHDKIHSRRADGENFGLGTTIVMLK